MPNSSFTMSTFESKAFIPLVISWILVLVDLVGNTLVILIILTNKSMKSPMNYLLVNLAVADIIVGTFFTPKLIFEYLFSPPDPDGTAGQIFCKVIISGNLAWIGGATPVLCLMAICFERFFAIMYPLTARLKLTYRKVKYIVIASWIFASILVTPLFAVMNYNQEIKKCTEIWPRKQPWLPKAFGFLWLTVAGFGSLAVMGVLYSRVIYTLWFKKSQVQGTQLAMLRSRKRVTKMVVTVSVVYFITWNPSLIFYVLIQLHLVVYSLTDIIPVLSILVLCNSAINPFIYSLQSESFSRHLKQLVYCRERTGKNRVVSKQTRHPSRIAE